MEKAGKTARKIGVAVVGFAVLLAGLIMLVLPGPGLLMIILGLIILSAEYEWAKRHLDKAKTAQKKIISKAKRDKSSKNTHAPKS